MVDSLVSTVGEKLKTVLQDEVALLVGVNSEIEKLSSTFTLIQAVLEDAESRRVKDKAVTIWLEKVKDVAYDVDDILDEWRTEALRPQAPDESDGSCFSFLVTCFLSYVTFFNHVMLRHNIGCRIKKVRGRLDSIEKEKSRLGLRVDIGERERVDSEVRRGEIRERETSSLLDPLIVGRGDEKKEVVDLLLGGSSREVNEVPFVISIVGMGGLGKTTLAQLIYNDENVKGHFDMRMWVCVSEDFDVKRITKSIIESATGKGSELSDLAPLQDRLHGMLQAKRFLLVLDDVWSHDSEKWDKLRLPFQAGAPGSRIIVTTRLEDVASRMGSTHMQKLDVLSDADCWLVFSRRALEHRSAEERSDLEEIGRQIVNRCGGVPLAAKTIGSAMCSRKTRSQWELVLRSEVWKSGDVLGGILPALLLSYHDLPLALKQCFTYFSIFPKDWMIEKGTMIKLWEAQGFICSEGSEDMEESGGLYFDDLLRRSLLQDAELEDEGNICCKMHDLVHDLAQSVSGSDFSLVQIGKQPSLNFNNVHHSFFVAYILATLYKAHKLRTLFLDSRISMVPRMSFHHWRRLRALDLSYTSIKKLSPTVGHLKHLRFLDLSHTGVEELPEEVCNCLNLQTLRLNWCRKLKKLPGGMKKMINLRHLEFKNSDDLRYLPQGIGRLTGLRTVSKFIVGGGNKGCKCGELKHLNHLQGSLRITSLEKNMSRDKAREAELNKKKHLHTLSFEYKDEDGELLDEEVKKMEDVLEFLQPHTNLKELAIQYYGGSTLPKWIEDPVFSHLVRITISFCWECIQLPGFGKLPSLKYLSISYMYEVRKVGVEFSGVDNNDGSGGGRVSFPKLETLLFKNMPNWEEWDLRGEVGEVMPSLLQLEVKWCPKLKELPTNLPPLLQKLTLQISNEGMLSSGGTLPVLPNLKHLIIYEGMVSSGVMLTSFPCGWLGQLKALETLEISECWVLQSLPDEELQQLTMLQELRIYRCPFLYERYGYGGEDRNKIARIPNITIVW
ncbi:disease resistance protein RGA2-like isoform X2 [Magnolia sinica]|uniref:disease resistance protein RGA2-like isoform X2 n=1 Tax=Magnolia sinica TaxID=86752 RepID=UPI00265809D3|nr:disease resistance protein RGA2-like isoform X2 [Magnolia sinica]